MSTSTPTSTTSSRESATNRYRWRVVDIVVASVLAVAVGFIFNGWNTLGYLWYQSADALTPGFGGVAVGIWLLGGVVGGIVIRKPGAAIYVETLAAVISALLGNIWGIETIYSGLAQGLGADLVFALFLYRSWGLVPSLLAGAGAGVGAWTLELFVSGNVEKGLAFNLTYLTTTVLSGAILAGLLGWFLVRQLANTGALSRFEVGREAQVNA